MSAAGEVQAKNDALASGAKPMAKGHGRERGRRSTSQGRAITVLGAEALCRRAMARARRSTVRTADRCPEGA